MKRRKEEQKWAWRRREGGRGGRGGGARGRGRKEEEEWKRGPLWISFVLHVPGRWGKCDTLTDIQNSENSFWIVSKQFAALILLYACKLAGVSLKHQFFGSAPAVDKTQEVKKIHCPTPRSRSPTNTSSSTLQQLHVLLRSQPSPPPPPPPPLSLPSHQEPTHDPSFPSPKRRFLPK